MHQNPSVCTLFCHNSQAKSKCTAINLLLFEIVIMINSKVKTPFVVVGDAARMADSAAMLTLCDPVHMVLIKTDPSGDTTLVSSHQLEWRTVLAMDNSRQNLPVEIMGVGMLSY